MQSFQKTENLEPREIFTCLFLNEVISSSNLSPHSLKNLSVSLRIRSASLGPSPWMGVDSVPRHLLTHDSLSTSAFLSRSSGNPTWHTKITEATAHPSRTFLCQCSPTQYPRVKVHLLWGVLCSRFSGNYLSVSTRSPWRLTSKGKDCHVLFPALSSSPAFSPPHSLRPCPIAKAPVSYPPLSWGNNARGDTDKEFELPEEKIH